MKTESVSEQNGNTRKLSWWSRKQTQEIHLEFRTQKDKKK